MSRLALATLLIAACGGGGGGGGLKVAPPPSTDGTGAMIVAEGSTPTAYDRAALDKALIGERAKEATGEKEVAALEAKGDDDAATTERALTARADLCVRRKFISALEACQAQGQLCPPRLDDPAWSFDVDGPADQATPSLDTPLRFDLASWRAITAELHGRACACRTMACVDGVGVAIDQLEKRPMAEVQADDAAIEAITAARGCLFRLRGLAVGPPRPRSTSGAGGE
jgi:hypothetical protein